MPSPDEFSPSRDEMIVTEAFRRRATAMAERCLPAIIREARYGQLLGLMRLFRRLRNAVEAGIGCAARPGEGLAGWRDPSTMSSNKRHEAMAREIRKSMSHAARYRTARDAAVAVESLRRRTSAAAARCLPEVLRTSGFDALQDLISVFYWFGSNEALSLEDPTVPMAGLTIEEANALVRLRIRRGDSFAPAGYGDAPPRHDAVPSGNARSNWETTASAQEIAGPAERAEGVAGVDSISDARRRLGGRAPKRVFQNGAMYWADPRTGRIISRASL
jgi:hypothetical protein